MDVLDREVDAQNEQLWREVESVKLFFRTIVDRLGAPGLTFAVLVAVLGVWVVRSKLSMQATGAARSDDNGRDVLLSRELPPAEAAAREFDGEQTWNGWVLAKELRSGDHQRIQTYTRLEDGLISLRFKGCLDSGVAEMLSLVQEFDLMPTWIKYAKAAGTLSQRSAHDFVVYADIDLHMWPIPQLLSLIEVVVASCGGRRVAATFCTPSHAAFDRAAVPAAARKRAEAPLRTGVVRFTPQPAGGGTEFEVVAAVELQALTFLGPARWAMRAAPSWLVNLAVSILIPYIWAQALDTLSQIQRAEGAVGGPFARRVAADRHGFYAAMRRLTGQRRWS